MLRTPVRPSLFCAALLLFTACSSDDGDEPGGDVPAVSQLTASALTLTTSEDTPLTATAEASGELGDLHATLIQSTSHGTLALSGGTSVTYTPNPDYAGADSAVITIRDDQRTVSVPISITVTPVNDPPRLSSTPSLSLDEDSFVTLGSSNLAVADVDSAASSIVVTVNPGNNYTVVGGSEVHPIANFEGALQLNVTISDGDASSNLLLDANVAPINDAPVNTVPPPITTTDDQPALLNGGSSLLVSDVDAPTLDVQLTVNDCTMTLAQTSGLNFLAGDGVDDTEIHFSGATSAINAALLGMSITPPLTFDGLCTVTIVTSDLGGSGSGGVLTATDSFNVGVNDVDLPPAITLPNAIVMNEDASFVFGGLNIVSVADSDNAPSTHIDVVLDAGTGALTLASVAGITFNNGTTNGSARLEFGGTFTAINAALVDLGFAPAANANGAQSLAMSVTEGPVGPITDTCGITVNPVNDPPAISHGPLTIALFQGSELVFTAGNQVGVGDLDNNASGVTLTIQCATGALSFAPGSPVTPQHPDAVSTVLDGTPADVNATVATMTWSPPSGSYRGTSQLVFNVSDQGNTGAGGPLEDELTLTIAVTAEPVALADTYATHGNVTLHVAAVSGVLANDVDLDGSVTVVDHTNPALGTLVLNANGSFDYTPTTGTPFLHDSFGYTIEDSDGNSASATVDVDILDTWWFVDSDNSSPGQDGSFDKPFAVFAQAVSAASPGSTIYVRYRGTSYPTPGPLSVFANVVGSGIDANLGPNGVISHTLPPTIDGTLVAMGSVALRGFALAGSGPSAAITSFGGDLALDHLLIDGFARALLVSTSSGTTTLDAVTMTNQTTAGIDYTSSGATTLNVTNSQLSGVADGVRATSTGGQPLHVTITNVGILQASGRGIVVDLDGDTGAGEPRQVAVRNCTLNNDPTGLTPYGTVGLAINVGDGAALVRVDNNAFNAWSSMGFDLTSGNNASVFINASVQDNLFNTNVPGSFSSAALESYPGTGGNVTVSIGRTVVLGDPLGVRIASHGAVTCYSLLNNLPGTGVVGWDMLTTGGVSIGLDSYNGVQSVPDYMLARNNFGNVAVNTTTFIGSFCMAPPSF